MVCLVVACDQAPDGVIPESKMEKLLVDLELADAYIDSHNDEYSNDSSRLALKQSIFLKHGVTPEMYDTSLVWYARNMEVYIKVYDNVIERLTSMRDKTNKESSSAPSPMAGRDMQQTQRHSYAATGDTADIWQGPRRWMFTTAMRNGFATFDFDPDGEYARGDRYELQLKVKPVRSNIRVFFAIDYNDGATAYIHRFSCSDGWNSMLLQSDSTREVKRIYGYVYYNIAQGDIAYVDSLALLRTHLDTHTYMAAPMAKVIERNKPAAAPAPVPAQPAARPAVEATVPKADSSKALPQGHFKPKAGVNKSSAQPHVTQSPNAQHLPQQSQK